MTSEVGMVVRIHSDDIHSPEKVRMRRVCTEILERARRAMTKPCKLPEGGVGVLGSSLGAA